MRLPDAASLAFLAWLLLVLPWLSIRGARLLRARRAAGSGALPLSRTALWTQTLVSQFLLFAVAWWVGHGFGYEPFGLSRPLDARAFAWAAAALAANFVLRQVARSLRTPEERRSLVVYAIAPRTAGERALAIATILVASVAEELAYRGVGLSILWWSLGNPWIAVFLCALAFAVAHAAQGWKSGVVIFAIALVMHGLVALTGTLVLAMAAHAVYDLVAGHRIREEALRMDAAAAAS